MPNSSPSPGCFRPPLRTPIGSAPHARPRWLGRGQPGPFVLAKHLVSAVPHVAGARRLHGEHQVIGDGDHLWPGRRWHASSELDVGGRWRHRLHRAPLRSRIATRVGGVGPVMAGRDANRVATRVPVRASLHMVAGQDLSLRPSGNDSSGSRLRRSTLRGHSARGHFDVPRRVRSATTAVRAEAIAVAGPNNQRSTSLDEARLPNVFTAR